VVFKEIRRSSDPTGSPGSPNADREGGHRISLTLEISVFLKNIYESTAGYLICILFGRDGTCVLLGELLMSVSCLPWSFLT
jgi:hypothetical protein